MLGTCMGPVLSFVGVGLKNWTNVKEVKDSQTQRIFMFKSMQMIGSEESRFSGFKDCDWGCLLKIWFHLIFIHCDVNKSSRNLFCLKKSVVSLFFHEKQLLASVTCFSVCETPGTKPWSFSFMFGRYLIYLIYCIMYVSLTNMLLSDQQGA